MSKEFNIFSNVIIYKPKLNDKFSWINSVFDLGIGLWSHLILMSFLAIIICISYKYIKHRGVNSKGIDLGFIFLVSGFICSLIDKIFWGGSLDFIRLKGLFTFDIKDCYLTLAEVIFLVMIVQNWDNIKSFRLKQIHEYIFKS